MTPPTRLPRKAPLLRLNFVTAVWLVIGLAAWTAVSNAADSTWVDRFYYAGYHTRALMAPYVVGALQLFFWFRFFRHEEDGARIFAGMMGVFVLVQLLLMALNWSVSGPWHPLVVAALCYIAGAHLAYALFGGRRRRTTTTTWIIES